MRLGVLDIGSNTGHLLVVDAYRGAAPLPASSVKEPLRLAEHLGEDNRITDTGLDLLVEFVGHALEMAEDKGCEQIYSFATSAVRDADNADEVLRKVRKKTGVDIRVLPGEDEARLTFLAVRRWFGWSSGRLAVFDIGGGSLEIAGGDDESPDVAWSLPLGAGRLTREHFRDGHIDDDDLRRLRKDIRTLIAHDAGTLLRGGRPDHAVATSKTFRSLARICGAAPSADGLFVRRILAGSDLEEWIPKLLEMDADEVAELPGVSRARSHQLAAGALVASAVLDIFDLPELEICPWALREGVILDRLDQLSAGG
ncbi:MAG: Ppx/GppA family phosphatase [Marmoricola sp.]|nr:Ppx/GppA family phosphatase [Marmoricola sp.]